MSEWFRYVAWERVDTQAEQGWEFVRNTTPTHHDHYGCIMKWVGQGDPPEATIDDVYDAKIAEFREETMGLFQP